MTEEIVREIYPDSSRVAHWIARLLNHNIVVYISGRGAEQTQADVTYSPNAAAVLLLSSPAARQYTTFTTHRVDLYKQMQQPVWFATRPNECLRTDCTE